MTTIYTVGHSNLPVAKLLSLLEQHSIVKVIDVRSAPYSAWAPQFNKHAIENELCSAGFEYVYAGDKIGGKPADESLYTHAGVPDYEQLGQSPAFLEGLDWLIQIASEKRVAIMCSEGDPFSCHRERLVGKKLRERGLEVLHITSDGEIVVQEQGELF